MSFTYVIEFDVIPLQRSRFLSLLEGVLDAMRSEPMGSGKKLGVRLRGRALPV